LVHGHWGGCEIRNHWVRDAQFEEDDILSKTPTSTAIWPCCVAPSSRSKPVIVQFRKENGKGGSGEIGIWNLRLDAWINEGISTSVSQG
jgi:hypothetical protein